MDAGYLKIKIDIKTEYDESKKKYSFKKKELKKEQIKKTFEGFKDFFKNDGNFKFKENDHSVVAEYKDHGVKLDIDTYKNTDSDDFNVTGVIETFEKEIFNITVEGVCNKDCILQPAFANDEERMVHETRYFKDFLDDEIQYNFKFKIDGRDELYDSMQALMIAL